MTTSSSELVGNIAFFAILAIILGIVIWMYFVREADIKREESQEPSVESLSVVQKMLDDQAAVAKREREYRKMPAILTPSDDSRERSA